MVFKLDSICARCRTQQIRFQSQFNQMADDPRWLSVVDHPAQIVRTGRKHGPGLIILGMCLMAHSSCGSA
jgi:surfeit locus 1 family protein